MTYFLNLFSPETWAAFRVGGNTVSGFSRHQRTQAQRSLQPGNNFLCYLVGLGRWCGALKIESEAFIRSREFHGGGSSHSLGVGVAA